MRHTDELTVLADVVVVPRRSAEGTKRIRIQCGRNNEHRVRANILLFASSYLARCRNVTEIHTPESALRIRVIRLPGPGELDEFELHHFRLGQAYVIPARLASILVLSGIAELIDSRAARVEAADSGLPRFPRPK